MMALARVTLLSIGLAAMAGNAWAAGDASRGEALARTWCSNCHFVDDNRRGVDTAPPLADIARRGAPDQWRARAFLQSPHPPMPNFNLATSQIDDIVAYLNGLTRK